MENVLLLLDGFMKDVYCVSIILQGLLVSQFSCWPSACLDKLL